MNCVFLLVPHCKNPPKITIRRNTVTVKEDKQVTLKCVVRSVRKDCTETFKTYYWRNPQNKLVEGKKETKGSKVRMTLTIEHVKKSDSGNYTCFAGNLTKKVSNVVMLKVK